MRKRLRRLATYIAGGLLAAIAYGVVGEFFIELARECGWYEHPSKRLDAIMSASSAFVTQTWFLTCASFFVGLALGMWADTILRRREAIKRPENADQPTIDEPPLVYVGEMTVSDRHLRDDLFLEIAARGFNATAAPVTVKHVLGYIACGDEQLPPPNLLIDSSLYDGTIPSRSEFILVLEQRLPKPVAERLLELPERVPLNMNKLNIMVTRTDEFRNEVRLPIYNGIMLSRDTTGRLKLSRIIDAIANDLVISI